VRLIDPSATSFIYCHLFFASAHHEKLVCERAFFVILLGFSNFTANCKVKNKWLKIGKIQIPPKIYLFPLKS